MSASPTPGGVAKIRDENVRGDVRVQVRRYTLGTNRVAAFVEWMDGRSKWRVVAFENDHACEKTDGFGWMDDGRDDAVVRSNLATDE